MPQARWLESGLVFSSLNGWLGILGWGGMALRGVGGFPDLRRSYGAAPKHGKGLF